MFKRIIVTALLAGLLAGLAFSVIQEFTTTPIILHAETFEGKTVSAVQKPAAPDGEEPWHPDDGFEWTLFTALSNVLTGIGFALIMVAGIALYRAAGRWTQRRDMGDRRFRRDQPCAGTRSSPRTPRDTDGGSRSAPGLVVVLCCGDGDRTVVAGVPSASHLGSRRRCADGHPALDWRTNSLNGSAERSRLNWLPISPLLRWRRRPFSGQRSGGCRERSGGGSNLNKVVACPENYS